MTPHEFRCWLEGYLEGNDAPDVERIREKASEIAELTAQPCPWPYPIPNYPLPEFPGAGTADPPPALPQTWCGPFELSGGEITEIPQV